MRWYNIINVIQHRGNIYIIFLTNGCMFFSHNQIITTGQHDDQS